MHFFPSILPCLCVLSVVQMLLPSTLPLHVVQIATSILISSAAGTPLHRMTHALPNGSRINNAPHFCCGLNLFNRWRRRPHNSKSMMIAACLGLTVVRPQLSFRSAPFTEPASHMHIACQRADRILRSTPPAAHFVLSFMRHTVKCLQEGS